MEKSAFNPKHQEDDLSSKIVAGLERISEVFKVLLWERAKAVGLSPIQIQILLFVAFHDEELNRVSHLAKEFNVTKPTISDAVKVLIKKELVEKDFSSSDNRSYFLRLSPNGSQLVESTGAFTDPLKVEIDKFAKREKESLFKAISVIIYGLNKRGVLDVQRTCYGCTHFRGGEGNEYCSLLQKRLSTSQIRLDCPEFELKADN